MQENRPKFRCWSPRCLLLGFVLASLTAVVLYAALPLQYPATATLLIQAERQQFLFEVPRSSHYNLFVNTQIALMRSPAVLDKVLQDSEIARLPIILKQRDKRGWLHKRLNVKPEGRSEIVSVSIKTDDASASEKIVNAVVGAFLQYVEDNDRKMVNILVNELTVEKRRQQAAAQTFQDHIRAQTKQVAEMGSVAGQEGMVAGLAPMESLQRDVDLAKSKLIALKAQYVATQNLIEKPSEMPVEVLLHMNPRFAELNEKSAKLQQEKNQILQMTSPNNPRVTLKDQEIAQVDEEIARMVSGTDGGWSNSMAELNEKKTRLQREKDEILQYTTSNNPRAVLKDQEIAQVDEEIARMTSNSRTDSMLEWMRIQEQVNLYSIEREIKMQEVYLTELENKYKEQLISNAERSEGAVDIEFMKTQLDRIDKTLNQIDARILMIQTESRRPGQIVHLTAAVPSMPNPMKQIVAAGAGFFTVFFAALFLGIVMDCFRFLGLCRKKFSHGSCCQTEDSSEQGDQ